VAAGRDAVDAHYVLLEYRKKSAFPVGERLSADVLKPLQRWRRKRFTSGEGRRGRYRRIAAHL